MIVSKQGFATKVSRIVHPTTYDFYSNRHLKTWIVNRSTTLDRQYLLRSDLQHTILSQTCSFVLIFGLLSLTPAEGVNYAEIDAKDPETLTEEEKIALLGRPKLGDITKISIRIRESKEFKVSQTDISPLPKTIFLAISETQMFLVVFVHVVFQKGVTRCVRATKLIFLISTFENMNIFHMCEL